MIKADFHIHSKFSRDSVSELDLLAKKAISIGLDTICITDHHEPDYALHKNIGTLTLLDPNAYFAEINDLSKKYRDKLTILVGVEVGLAVEAKNTIDEFLKNNDFDFAIGSSHLVDGEKAHLRSFYESRNVDDAYFLYFNSILKNTSHISSYDVYGHIDYALRYGPSIEFSHKHYGEIIEAILTKIINNGNGIEINTGGIYKGSGSIHPRKWVLEMYKSLGGEIVTVGSDSHNVEKLGYGFDAAEELLITSGFKYYTTFKKRKPIFLKI